MNQNFRKTALAVISLATLAAVSAACSSSKSSTNNTLDPALKSTGGAANLACNGTNADPTTLNTNMTITIHTVVQPLTGSTFPDLGGARVAVYDVATGTTNSALAVTTGTSGVTTALGTIVLKDSTRYAFAVTHAPNGSVNYVPTYQFNSLTPVAGTSAGTAASTINLRMIDSTLYSAFIGFAGLSPSSVAGKTQLAGAVTDCDGDTLKNVVVADLPSCKNATTFPCVAYFASGAPTPNASATDGTGQFVVAGITPGAAYTVHLKALVSSSASTAVEIGKLTVNGKADAVALGTTQPLAP